MLLTASVTLSDRVSDCMRRALLSVLGLLRRERDRERETERQRETDREREREGD
jgi:hypothetical protein